MYSHNIEILSYLRLWSQELYLYKMSKINKGQEAWHCAIPCSTLLLLAGTWGNCRPLRADEDIPADEEYAVLACG